MKFIDIMCLETIIDMIDAACFLHNMCKEQLNFETFMKDDNTLDKGSLDQPLINSTLSGVF